MGFVSYNEDVQKRWESDNHELLRKLESDTVSMLQQKHALPEFELLVAKLGEILADPSQPYAMHLMKMRTRERDLVEQNEKLSKKRTELSDKNSMLNEKIRLLEKDNSSRLIQLSKKINDNKLLEKKIDALFEKERQYKAEIFGLERSAMEAQVNRRV